MLLPVCPAGGGCRLSWCLLTQLGVDLSCCCCLCAGRGTTRCGCDPGVVQRSCTAPAARPAAQPGPTTVVALCSDSTDYGDAGHRLVGASHAAETLMNSASATLQQAKQVIRFQSCQDLMSKRGPAKLLSNQAFKAFMKAPLSRCGAAKLCMCKVRLAATTGLSSASKSGLQSPAECPAQCAELPHSLDESTDGEGGQPACTVQSQRSRGGGGASLRCLSGGGGCCRRACLALRS